MNYIVNLKQKKSFLVWMLLSFAINPIISAQSSLRIDVSKYFNGHTGCFVVYNMTNQQYRRYNGERCNKRFTPASTFKIPNSIIGLETGVIPDENYVIKWDSVTRPIKEWNRDNTLTSAIQYSVVPYYQELARRVGREKMQAYLKKIRYGNMNIGGNVDSFWLDNSLKISANEQIEFLKKFYEGKLPCSKRTIDIVKKILPEEQFSHSRLRFKTGTGISENGAYIGWLVGYVEKGTDIYIFAMNVEAASFDEVKNLRNDIPRNVLKFLNILE
jgi:beta-lactamase class D